MNENPVDFSEQVGYNDNKDDEYVLVDMSQAEPLNDLECKHETLVPDPNDKIGDAIYHGCQNPKCGRGWYIRHEDKNIT